MNTPSQPRLVRLSGTDVRVSWGAPIRPGYSFNVYAAIEGTIAPLPGPPIATSLTLEASFSLDKVIGNSPPIKDILVSITSVNKISLAESPQSATLYINIHSNDPGLDNMRMVSRDPTGAPTYLATDEDGRLQVLASVPAPIGGATEAKQDAQITILNSIDAGIPASLGATVAANSMPVALATNQIPLPILDILIYSQQTDVPIGTSAVDVLQAPSIPVPLSTRKIVVLQNNSARDILVGTSALQGHVIPRTGGVRSFSAGAALSLFAKVSTGTAILNVWELG